MSNQPTACNDERLRQLLVDQLPDDLDPQVVEHVAACARCRQMLESLAGEPAWWSDVESCLRANAQGNKPAGDEAGVSRADAERMDLPEDDASFLADFSVDFLAPCSQGEALGRISDYEIVGLIGRGGMGVVLKGFQRDLGRFVAVKVMAPHLAVSGAARQRFIREARAAAAIVHPNVMPIHAVNAEAKLPLLVMPYVDCESLQQRLDRCGPLELAEILRIAAQAAAALAAAHAQGLVHRDVKPGNILLEKGVDRVLLTDFGLARAVDDASLTRTGVIAGTPQFMSPEQGRGEPVDARSDMFSLGSVLYAMCTGRPPFRAETSYGVLRRITDNEPRSIREINPEIPAWLERIVRRLHQKLPPERYPDANQVAELLGQCLAHVQQPTLAPLPQSLSKIESPRGVRRGLVWGALFSAAISAVLLMAAVLWQINVAGTLRVPSPGNQQDTPSSTDSPLSAALLSDEVIGNEARALGNDLSDFEQRFSRLWDDSDPSTPLPPLE